MIRRLSPLTLAVVAVLFGATTSPAQTTYTWNGGGGDNNWSTAANWGGTAPVSDVTNSLLVFGGTTRLVNTLDANLSANSLTFNATAGAFNLGAGAGFSLTLGTGGITNANNLSQIVNIPLILAANQSFTNNSTSTGTQLFIRNTLATGGNTLTIAGTGVTSLEGAVSGGGTIVKNDAGTLNLFGNNANAGLTVNGGTVGVAPAAAANNPLGTGLVTLGGGTLAFRTSINLTPVGLTTGTFNQDVVRSLTDPATTLFGTTANLDGSNFVLYEKGVNTGNVNLGLPSGGFLTSETNPNQTFQLQGYGSTAANVNNVLQVTGTGTGTITLATPGSFSQIAIANMNGGGNATFNATLNFSDATTAVFTGLAAQNWFDGPNAIIQTNVDRMLNTTGVFGGLTTNPRIYSTTLTLATADQAKTLNSITITKTNATGILNIFGLSGGSLAGTTGVPTTQTYTNNFAVTANSTLSMGSLTSLTIGNLSLGAVLSVTSGIAAPVLNTGAVSMTANGGLSLPGGMVYTPPAAVTGAFGFTKSGTGQIVLTKANTFSSYTQTAGVTGIVPEGAGVNPLGTGTVTLGGGTMSFRGPAVTPIGLTAASFNQDVIAAVAEQALASPFGTTTSVDAPAGFAYYEQGRTGSNPALGLPASRTIVSANNPNQTFQLQPYSNGAATNNNAALIANVVGSTTLTLSTPASFAQLALATASGSGATTMDVVLNFSTGASSTYAGIAVPDWFNGANFIIQGIDRLNRTSGAYDNNTTNPRIYANTLILTPGDASRLLTSVTINKTNAAGFLNIFALSGGSGGVLNPSFTNAFAVTAASTIDVSDISSLTIGGLTLGSNLTFTTSSGTTATPVRFTAGAVTLSGNTQISYPNTITPTFGQFSDGGTARTVTKAGTGILTINTPAGAGVTTTPLNLAGGSTFTASGGTVNLSATNSITAAAAGPFTVNVTGATVNATVANAISSITSGNLTLGVTGGTATLSGVNAFSSTTGVVTFNVSGGTATLSGANALAAITGRTNLTQTGGTINLNAANTLGAASTTVVANSGTLNVAAGNNYGIGSLASSATVNSGHLINLNGTTLTINGSDGVASSTYRGRITNGAVAVSGGNTTFAMGNPYAGGLTITGGKVNAPMPGSIGTGTVTLGNGTLSLAGMPGSAAINGFTSSLFTLNGTAGGPTINNSGAGATSSLTITTATTNVARSAFVTSQIPVDSDFTVAFRYSQNNATDPANGVTITIQGTTPTFVGGNAANFAANGIAPAFTLAFNAQEAGVPSPGVNGFQNGAITNTFFNPPSPGFPDVLQADPAGTLQIFFELTYNAASGTFTGRYGQRSPLDPNGPIIYIPLSDAQPAIGVFNGVIPAANMAYNLRNNIGGAAYIGVTGSTNGTAAQTTQQVIDQFVITGGTNAATLNPIPASTNYAQAFAVANDATASLNILTKTGVATLSGGALTIGTGNTGLTLGTETGSVADIAYGMTFGATTINGNPTFTVNNNGTGTGTLTLGALTGGATARTITKAGPGTMVLGTAAASLAAGSVVNVNAGVLTLNNATALGTTATLNTVAGTTVNANAAATLANLTGAGNLNIGANILTVGGADNLSGTFSGSLNGTTGSLVKAGTGTLNLTGANTYTGTTTVNQGTLAVNNITGTGTGTGTTTVASGARIMGIGTIGGNLTIATGGAMAPGNSIGVLNANTGISTWSAGAKYTVEYIPGASFTPGVTIDHYNSLGTLDVTALNTAGNQFTIELVRLPGGTSPAPTFATIATFSGGTSGNGFAADRFTFTGDFAGATPTIALVGNSVVISFTPVPEPTTVLGLGAAAFGLAGLVRRRMTRKAA